MRAVSTSGPWAGPQPLLLPALTRPGGEVERVVVPRELAVTITVAAGPWAGRLTEAALDAMGLTRDVAFARAFGHARVWCSGVEPSFHPGAPDLLMWGGGPACVASRVWQAGEHPWPGAGCVWAVPAPDRAMLLRLDGSDRASSLALLATAAGVAFDDAEEPLSDQLFWFRGGVWAHVPVRRGRRSWEVVPPPALIAALGGPEVGVERP